MKKMWNRSVQNVPFAQDVQSERRGVGPRNLSSKQRVFWSVCGLAASTLLLNCGENKFTSGALKPREAIRTNAAATAIIPDTFSFKLQLVGNPAVIPPGMQKALLSVSLQSGEKTTLLTPEETAKWKVGLSAGENTTLLFSGTPGEVDVDFTKFAGMTLLHAKFMAINSPHHGKAATSVFVDTEKPVTVFVEQVEKTTDDNIEFEWSATDNYAVDKSRFAIVACVKGAAAPANATTLSPDCAVVATAAQLAERTDGHFTSKGADIGGKQLGPKNLAYYYVAVDAAGNVVSQLQQKSSETSTLLQLSSSAQGSLVTSPTRTVKVPLDLVWIEKGMRVAPEVIAEAGKNGELELVITQNTSEIVMPYSNTLVLKYPEDVRRQLDIVARKKGTEIFSNRVNVNLIVDTVSPVISGLSVDVPGGSLSASSMPILSWRSLDYNGIKKQSIEIRVAGSQTWEKVADLAGSETTLRFAWGAGRALKSFQFRVTATDIAGNSKTVESISWVPQFFNAAVLTKDVGCFWCHLKVEGDVAGIDFPLEDVQVDDPANPGQKKTIKQARADNDSGEVFELTGNFYSTNLIPPTLAEKTKGKIFENYRNTDLLVFPKSTDANGVPTFPILTGEYLRDKVMGSLRLKDTYISRVYKGNLVLDGSGANAPIELLGGEVFVDGDLIIKGRYKGRGTIYAQNIFIVDDLTATSSPFPYPADLNSALAKARQDILDNKDGLYLGAVKNVYLGSLHGDTISTPINPYSWYSKDKYVALGRPPAYQFDVKANKEIKYTSYCCFVPQKIVDGQTIDDFSAPKYQIEVARVDAYLYATNEIDWHTYNSFVLNGGFMSPKSKLVSHTARFELDPNLINLRNGQPSRQSVIRYDYRLRVGGEGFEALKLFFDSNTGVVP